MIKFAVAYLLGVGTCAIALAYGPASLQPKARQAGVAVQEKVNEMTYQHCEHNFLDETHCYQTRSQKECNKEIEQKCGAFQHVKEADDVQE